MSRGLGYATVLNDLGEATVRETLTCSHCNKIYLKPSVREPSGFCRMCMRPVCLTCGADDKCAPFEKKLEKIEARDRLMRSLG